MYRIAVLLIVSSLFISGCLLAERAGLAEKSTDEKITYDAMCLDEIRRSDFEEKMRTKPTYAKWMLKKCPEVGE